MACVYKNWQQNGRIPNFMSLGEVTLIRKDTIQGDHISNYRPITLLIVELKILAKVFAKGLVRVSEETCRENTDS